jgi:hypothetical protein
MARINNSPPRAPQAAWGGIILSILGIHWQDAVQTAVLALIGTTASFCASVLLKALYKKIKKS